MTENFDERIEKNNQYYKLFYNELKNRSEKRNYSELIDIFLRQIKLDGDVLDIGCGTGIHLLKFKELGINAVGVEPSPDLLSYCRNQGLTVVEGSFENLLNINFENKISGIWCASSLLHVPKENLSIVIGNLRRIISKDVPIFITLRLGNEAIWDSFDSNSNKIVRFSQLYNAESIIEQLEINKFKIVYKRIEDSYWARPVEWLSLVAISH